MITNNKVRNWVNIRAFKWHHIIYQKSICHNFTCHKIYTECPRNGYQAGRQPVNSYQKIIEKNCVGTFKTMVIKNKLEKTDIRLEFRGDLFCVKSRK